MTELDEIDAELDRLRLEAQKRIARSRKIAKYVVGTILGLVVILLVLFLGQYSDLLTIETGLTVLGIVAILAGVEVAALKFNSQRENPWPDAAVSVLFLILLFIAVSAVI